MKGDAQADVRADWLTLEAAFALLPRDIVRQPPHGTGARANGRTVNRPTAAARARRRVTHVRAGSSGRGGGGGGGGLKNVV